MRLLLACAVVVGHSGGFFLVGGVLAVKLFYVISGFLIYHILNDKSYSNLTRFYTNRALRIFPLYFFVLSITILLGFHYQALSTFNELTLSGKIILLISNLFIFFQDWLFFLSLNDNSISFTSNFMLSDVIIPYGIIIPQSWTLSAELSFYLVAPFVLKSTYKLLLLLMFSIIINLLIYYGDLMYNSPWNYRFFPAELFYFLLGALSRKVFMPIFQSIGLIKKTNVLVCSFIFYSLGSYLLMIKPNYFLFKDTLSVLVVLISLPFLFSINNVLDKSIGNLSYPIYLNHILIINLYNRYLSDLSFEHNTTIILASSLIMALISNAIIDNKIGVIREKIKSSRQFSP